MGIVALLGAPILLGLSTPSAADPGPPAPGTTVCISLDPSGATADGSSGNPVVSGSGRFVAFTSTATNLGVNGRRRTMDVFVRNVNTGVTRLASVNSRERPANEWSYSYGVSTNGRYVLFASVASNLVPRDTNERFDAFVRDLREGITRRVSVTDDEKQFRWAIDEPSMSGDGRFVAFTVFGDVYLRDLQKRTTRLVSVNNAGRPANRESFHASISGNGRYVAFSSYASNLAPGTTPDESQVFVRDVRPGSTELVSVAHNGTPGDGSSSRPAISRRGRYISFTSGATDLVRGDTNARQDVFLRDRALGTTERVSVTSRETQARGDGLGLSIDSDVSNGGRLVAFHSKANDLVPGDTNRRPDVFVRDRETGRTLRVSVNTAGEEGNVGSFDGSLPNTGSFVAFGTSATNLTPQDTNRESDVYLHGLGTP